MKEIKRYEASDESMFDTSIKCIEYEGLIESVNIIMKDLTPLPKDEHCRFANGKGFIQQDKFIIDHARNALTSLGNSYLKQTKPWRFSMIGRLFDDANNSCLYSAWNRLSNTDYLYREWGQGYYAVNPDKGVQEPYKEEI